MGVKIWVVGGALRDYLTNEEVTDIDFVINKDIKKAKNLKNIEGIIVGKAIYDGDIQLEELVKEDA